MKKVALGKGPYYNPNNNFPLREYKEVPEASYGEPPCIDTTTYRPFTFETIGNEADLVIFIPKKTIQGLIPDYDTRISQICPHFFRVHVAINTKPGCADRYADAVMRRR